GIGGLSSSDIGRDPCPCDRSSLDALDRGTAGRNSMTASHASDAAFGVVFTGAFALDALAVRRDADRRATFLDDSIVIGEAVLIDAGVNEAVKAAVHRPRPLLYGLPAGDP